jgi:hypothetical protein
VTVYLCVCVCVCVCMCVCVCLRLSVFECVSVCAGGTEAQAVFDYDLLYTSDLRPAVY